MRIQFPSIARFAAVVVVSAGLGLAGQAAPAQAAQRAIMAAIDEAQIVRIDGQVAEVIIGNPSVADVAVQSGRTLVVTGKSFGITNMIVLDAAGDEILNVKMTVGADSGRLVRLTKGTARETYVCTPECQPALQPGDAPDYFENLSGQTTDKFGVARSVLDEGGSSPQ